MPNDYIAAKTCSPTFSSRFLVHMAGDAEPIHCAGGENEHWGTLLGYHKQRNGHQHKPYLSGVEPAAAV